MQGAGGGAGEGEGSRHSLHLLSISQGSRYPDFILLSLFALPMGLPMSDPTGSPHNLHTLAAGRAQGEEAGVTSLFTVA